MHGKEFAFNAVIAAVGTTLSAWLGGWDIALKVLIVMMVIDYATGFPGAIFNDTVNSEVMYKGGIRKIVILAVVALAFLFDQMLNNTEPILRTLAIYFYAARGGISVTENLGIIGVPLPPAIAKVLEQLQTKGDSTK